MRRQGGKESTDLLPPESADPVLTPASSRQPVLSWLALRRPRTAFPLLSAPPLPPPFIPVASDTLHCHFLPHPVPCLPPLGSGPLRDASLRHG